MRYRSTRLIGPIVSLVLLLAIAIGNSAAAEKSNTIDFTQETLPNGLRVIYAPLKTAPVVEVRVFYHVGSRDERPDRQGFAHMFEHMMFRGSAHVKPQEHMKILGAVGAVVNAFTSFDQTVYHETLPASALETALYLEADRMASFKVSDQIFGTERKVVAEEWRMRYMNQPYGRIFGDFQKAAFSTHSYRWTPIGDMDQLRASRSNELQDFFNTYYVPNNAILVVAGDIDTPAAKALVSKYFAWIPRGADVVRDIPVEPPQTAARVVNVSYRVQLPRVEVGWRLPGYQDPDQPALDLLRTIVGGGRSGRLPRLLVSNDHPLAVDAVAHHFTLEDAGLFMVDATVMQGKDPAEVEKVMKEAVADVVANGVTQEELEKAKTQVRIELVNGRETATDIAEQVGEEALLTGDPNRVNTDPARTEAVTLADIQRVAKKYLLSDHSITLRVTPDPLGKAERAAATQAAMSNEVVPPSKPVKARDVVFPKDWPAHAPEPHVTATAHFDKGTEATIDGVKVIVLTDTRLPLVNWSLTTRHGSFEDPKGKEGASMLSNAMLHRGSAGLTFDQIAKDLESRAITIDISDGRDITRLAGNCTTPELEHALERSRQLYLQPTFDPAEFAKLKERTVNEIALSEDNPQTVAGEDLSAAVWGDTPLGRHPTTASVSGITLDDVKQAYARNFSKDGAILMFSGDVTAERGQQLAKQLLDGWTTAGQPAPDLHVAGVTPARRHIILVDRPAGRQSSVRIAIPAYDIRDPEKFTGSIAGQILSGGGIDSRLMRYVRAEKGLAYGVHGVFQPGRHNGAFVIGTETAVESTADAIDAIFKVITDMKNDNVTPEELAMAKTRVAGGLLMGMQTIGEQASFRVDAILNGYPIDYYDTYPAKVDEISAEQVKAIMNKYVDDTRMTIVVVCPAEQALTQLKRLGDVEVVPMPAKREGATTQPGGELLKPKP
ncbi:MAG TPA: pitrilysin family protein [Tepidisphaeraceae bacterium]|jgi:zinc protease|nr:pitrilysin family protein [Tepidisphaeraceae bacterium]